jgi:exonuclease VII large subunit
MTYKKGKLVKSVVSLQKGDQLMTKFIDGDSNSVVESTNPKKENI